MAATRRHRRNSSSDSSGRASSSDDDALSTTIAKPIGNKTGELTLKDDEDTIDLQAPLPEEYGKKKHFIKNIF